jgi:hypothetical protein
MTELEAYRLDLVAAGLTDDDPWSERTGFSKPWKIEPDGTRRVLATAPGENALLVALDRFCVARESG